MRTWPASTSSAALLRAFTTRACHSHLSRRWRSKRHHGIVMPGLVPGIHVLTVWSKQDVDGRVKPGHDEKENQPSLRLAASWSFSAASLAKGELGSAGRSRSRGAALVAHGRCEGPLSRPPLLSRSRPPLSRPPLSRPPPNLPSNLPFVRSPSRPLSPSLPLPASPPREDRRPPRGGDAGAPSAAATAGAPSAGGAS